MSRTKKRSPGGNGGNSAANSNAGQGNGGGSSDAKAKNKEDQKAAARTKRKANRRKATVPKKNKQGLPLPVRKTHSFKPHPSATNGGAGYGGVKPGKNFGQTRKKQKLLWHARREEEIMDIVYDESISPNLPIDENRDEIPPWVTSRDDRPHDIWKEIVDFSQFCSLTDVEKRRRQSIVDKFTSIVNGIWPEANVQVFGSFATGLSILSSDIDIVVTGAERCGIRNDSEFPSRIEDTTSGSESEELISIEAGDPTERNVTQLFHERRDEMDLDKTERANNTSTDPESSTINDMPLVFIDRVGDANNGEVIQSSDGNIDENRRDMNVANEHLISDVDPKSTTSSHGSTHEGCTDAKTKDMISDDTDGICDGNSKGSGSLVEKDATERELRTKHDDRLEILADALRKNKQFAKYVVTVPKAKVPLVKFTAMCTYHATNSEANSDYATFLNSAPDCAGICNTGYEEIACDVSFDCVSGVEAIPAVESMLDEYPEARPLFLVVKTLISQKKLNDVVTGGLGSFALFIMVISHLQQWEMNFKDIIPFEDKQLRLLDSFFQLYGLALPVDEVGISVRSLGTYYQRRTRYPNRVIRQYPNGTGLSIEDPLNVMNELGTNCYRLRVIRDLFTNAAKVLSHWFPSPVEGATFTSTPLASIIRITQQMRDRRSLVNGTK